MESAEFSSAVLLNKAEQELTQGLAVFWAERPKHPQSQLVKCWQSRGGYWGAAQGSILVVAAQPYPLPHHLP